MHARSAMPVRWRRLIAGALAWLLIAQGIGWSTHALTHLNPAAAEWGEPAATLTSTDPMTAIGSMTATGPADGGDSGGLPAEHGCSLCGALNQGSLALVTWLAALASPAFDLAFSAPIDLTVGHGRPPVHHPSRAPPVPSHLV